MEACEEMYDRPGAHLTSPIWIGEYSCHANLELEPNDTNLRYLINVEKGFEPNFDLDEGFENYITKNPKAYENDMIHLQKWAISEKSNYGSDYQKVFRDAEMVCCRGTLTDVARTPYYMDDPWRIIAVRHDGIIYLHNCGIIDGNTFVPPPANSDSAHFTYWGHSFQKIMTSSDASLAQAGIFDHSSAVDCRETYNAIHRADIFTAEGDRVKLAYSSEIKAVNGSGEYIEFKTQFARVTDIFYRYKSWFWWLQSQFASIDKIFTGIRDGQGIVRKVQVLNKKFLYSRSERRCDVVMNFLATVLAEVKERCKDTVQIRYSPETGRVHFEEATRNTDFLIPTFINHLA